MIDMHLGVDPRMKEPYIVTPTSMVAEGDKVVVEAYGSGISRFNERPYRQRYCFHLTLKDGLIVEGKVYQDTLHIWDTWVWSVKTGALP
jgi:ketosteroid isomerase-like protein